ncbi:hypothetical protein XFEB_02261 [Xylella fastidiosa EB92.1]|nr:hypothetical protein XFEB_02261 [Xylella fastidiosa EB92.1]
MAQTSFPWRDSPTVFDHSNVCCICGFPDSGEMMSCGCEASPTHHTFITTMSFAGNNMLSDGLEIVDCKCSELFQVV